MELKKPDNVAENPGLLPYGSNLSAPSIKIENIDGWKSSKAYKVNKQFQTKYEELKEEYQNLHDLWYLAFQVSLLQHLSVLQ